MPSMKGKHERLMIHYAHISWKVCSIPCRGCQLTATSPEVFNMDKIRRMVKFEKEFHCQIVSDGVGVSLLFHVRKRVLHSIDKKKIQQMYYNVEFIHEIGIGPGYHTVEIFV